MQSMNFIHIGTPQTKPSPDAQIIHALEAEIDKEKSIIQTDRPKSVIDRIHSLGRLTADERVSELCDDHSPWLLGEFQGFDTPREGRNKPYRLGVLCALGKVCSRQVMIVANDNTIAAGSWWPGSSQKIVAALKTALQLRIPVLYLIECAGLFLPHQDQTFAAHDGAGAIFEMQAQLSRAGIRQMAAIFGDCIAGGGYMPLLCDKIVMTEQASLYIGGSAITSHAKGSDNSPFGTASVHVHLSGCAENRVPDDHAAIQKLRAWLEALPSPALAYFRLEDPVAPEYSIDDLYHLLPTAPNEHYIIENIVARLADASQIAKLHDEYGTEIFASIALFDGLPAVVIANRAETVRENNHLVAGGILYHDGITKIRRICENANDDGLPVIWLQDVSGFDVGPDAERQGLLRHGAMLLRTLSIQTAPHLTIILRKASGAGYYAMKGAPFHPALTLSTAISHLEVMSPQTLAGTLFDKKIARADDSQKAALIEAKEQVIQAQIQSSSPKSAAIRADVDEIIRLSDLRSRIIHFLHAAYQDASRPFKPQRLWSILN